MKDLKDMDQKEINKLAEALIESAGKKPRKGTKIKAIKIQPTEQEIIQHDEIRSLKAQVADLKTLLGIYKGSAEFWVSCDKKIEKALKAYAAKWKKEEGK